MILLRLRPNTGFVSGRTSFSNSETLSKHVIVKMLIVNYFHRQKWCFECNQKFDRAENYTIRNIQFWGQPVHRIRRIWIINFGSKVTIRFREQGAAKKYQCFSKFRDDRCVVVLIHSPVECPARIWVVRWLVQHSWQNEWPQMALINFTESERHTSHEVQDCKHELYFTSRFRAR